MVKGIVCVHGLQVLDKEGNLVELADSPLAGNVRIFTDYDPEWEIDPATIKQTEKIGESGGLGAFESSGLVRKHASRFTLAFQSRVSQCRRVCCVCRRRCRRGRVRSGVQGQLER